MPDVIEEAAQALYDSAPNNTRTWSVLPDELKELHRKRARIVQEILAKCPHDEVRLNGRCVRCGMMAVVAQ